MVGTVIMFVRRGHFACHRRIVSSLAAQTQQQIHVDQIVRRNGALNASVAPADAPRNEPRRMRVQVPFVSTFGANKSPTYRRINQVCNSVFERLTRWVNLICTGFVQSS